MLCPKCGTDVGDRQTLCPKCEAAEASSRSSGTLSGGSLGAIRPAVKVVRLKPGETAESYRQGSSASPAQKHHLSGESAGIPHDSFGQANSRFTDYQPEPQRRSALPFLFFVCLALVLPGGIVLIRSLGKIRFSDFHYFDSEPQKPPPDFAHIVIHERKEVIVDEQDVIGAIGVDGVKQALNEVTAVWNPAKNFLDLEFKPHPKKESDAEPHKRALLPSGELEPDYGPLSAHIGMQFEAGTQRLDIGKLLSYTVDIVGIRKPVHFFREYSKQLAAFGEVSQLNGTLKSGEKVHGSLKDERMTTVDDVTFRLSWELVFDTVLQTAPAVSAAAPAKAKTGR